MPPAAPADAATLVAATPSLDFGDPAVDAFARAAADDATDPRARAALLFRAVRDGVRYDPYGVDLRPEAFRASAVLARRRGFCVHKAILLCACLRWAGVPARLGFADVTNHLATARLRAVLRTDVFAFHGWAEAWLGGRWVKATPAFDAATCARFGVAPLDFDGEHDALLQPLDGTGRRFLEYGKDRGIWDDFSYDAMMDAWREVYPHMFGLGAPAPVEGAGSDVDFGEDGEREREGRSG